MLVLLPLTLTK